MSTHPPPRGTRSSSAASSAARTSSGAPASSARSSRASGTPSGWSAPVASARRASSGAGAAGAAQPRDAVRRALLGPAGQRRRPRARRRPAGRASRTARRSAAPPTSRSRTSRACRSPRCSRRSSGARSAAGWRLLLLVDEAEELLVVSAPTRGVLARLRRVFATGPTSARSSPRRGASPASTRPRTSPTSPFLHGLHPAGLPDAAVPRRGPRPPRPRRLRPEDVEVVMRADRQPPVPAAAPRPAGSSRAATSPRRSSRSPPTRWSRTTSRWTSDARGGRARAPRAGRARGEPHPPRPGARPGPHRGRARDAALRALDARLSRPRRRRLPPRQLVLRALAAAEGRGGELDPDQISRGPSGRIVEIDRNASVLPFVPFLLRPSRQRQRSVLPRSASRP